MIWILMDSDMGVLHSSHMFLLWIIEKCWQWLAKPVRPKVRRNHIFQRSVSSISKFNRFSPRSQVFQDLQFHSWTSKLWDVQLHFYPFFVLLVLHLFRTTRTVPGGSSSSRCCSVTVLTAAVGLWRPPRDGNRQRASTRNACSPGPHASHTWRKTRHQGSPRIFFLPFCSSNLELHWGFTIVNQKNKVLTIFFVFKKVSFNDRTVGASPGSTRWHPPASGVLLCRPAPGAARPQRPRCASWSQPSWSRGRSARICLANLRERKTYDPYHQKMMYENNCVIYINNLRYLLRNNRTVIGQMLHFLWFSSNALFAQMFWPPLALKSPEPSRVTKCWGSVLRQRTLSKKCLVCRKGLMTECRDFTNLARSWEAHAGCATDWKLSHGLKQKYKEILCNCVSLRLRRKHLSSFWNPNTT